MDKVRPKVEKVTWVMCGSGALGHRECSKDFLLARLF
jgi:hypothetical protein